MLISVFLHLPVATHGGWEAMHTETAERRPGHSCNHEQAGLVLPDPQWQADPPIEVSSRQIAWAALPNTAPPPPSPMQIMVCI